MLFFFKNIQGEIFGGFFTHLLETSPNFYGNGQSFLFSIV